MAAPDPYRSRGAPRPPEPEPVGDDGLDAATFARRRRLREAQAAIRRAEDAARAVRIRGGVALVLGLVALLFGAPTITSGGYTSRSLGRMVVLGPALLAYGVWALAVGAGGADSMENAPRWVQIGGGIAAGAGALVGILLLAAC